MGQPQSNERDVNLKIRMVGWLVMSFMRIMNMLLKFDLHTLYIEIICLKLFWKKKGAESKVNIINKSNIEEFINTRTNSTKNIQSILDIKKK